MAYVKQNWANDEVITKAKLDHIENGIAEIELTPGEQGEQGIQGIQGIPGTPGTPGAKGADAVIPKLVSIVALAEGADVVAIRTAFNSLIADLKAKGYML